MWKQLVQAALKVLPPRRPVTGWYGSRHAGMRVNEGTAMQLAAVYRAVAYISQTIMSLPWHTQNPALDRILHIRPNEEQPAGLWRETMLRNVLLWGNAYSEVDRSNNGRVLGFGGPIRPTAVRLDRDEGGRLLYIITTEHGVATIPARDMIHIRAMGDGVVGESVIRYGARSMGVALAQEENVGSFFGNGSRASGVLTHPTVIGEKGRDNLTKYINDNLQGPQRNHSILVLEEGMKWDQMAISSEDAELLESRRFSVEEIARWFGLPPHILMDYGRATWNNLEQASTEAVRSGILPWVVKLEQEVAHKLGAENVINIKGLLRADTKTRNESYALGRQWGWLSANEIREMEDMAPFDGGDTYLQPMNMVDASAPPPPQARRVMLADAWERIVTRELNEIKRNSRREDFLGWLEKWMPGHKEYTLSALKPVAELHRLVFKGHIDVAAFVDDYATTVMDAVRVACNNDDIDGYCQSGTAYVEHLVDEWVEMES